MAMTYAQLVTAVQDYTQNTFDTTDINTMIKQAEQRIYNTVQLASLRKNQTGVVSVGNPYLSCPGDFLSTYSLAVISDGVYTYLLNKDVNFIREAYPSTAASQRGLPKHYAIFGPSTTDSNELTFMVGPTPDAAYDVELHYFYIPESIVTATTTWLGDNFDSALLYGTLAEAGVYMKSSPDDAMYQMYQERYVQAIALLKNLGDGKQRMDAYRDGQVRVQVS